MIGQNKLKDKLNKFEYSTLPKAIIFEGEFGCGKHLVVDYLAKKYNISIKDISLDISNDLLMESYLVAIPKFYIVDIDKAANSKKIVLLQNTLLKFIEEPPQLANIFILCTNKNQVLPTVQNRCQIFTFEKYTIEQLKQFCSKNSIEDVSEILYEVYNTPGKLLALKNGTADARQIETLIINIITNIHKANVSNALTIANKIDFGNGGYNLDIFIHMMKRLLLQKMQEEQNFDVLKQYYVLTQDLSKQLILPNANKQFLFENYILNLKSV